jgi:CRISPR-associated protein Csd1
MILNELVKFYEREIANGNQEFAPIGLERKEVGFAIVIDEDGNFVCIEDIRSGDKKPRGRDCLVPQGSTRTVGVKAQLLWDNLGYVLGYDESAEEKKQERTRKEHSAFKERVALLVDGGVDDPSIKCVNRFLQSFDISDVKKDQLWSELTKYKGNISFRLQGHTELACESKAAHQAATNNQSKSSDSILCMVTGQRDELARLHTLIKGVFGAQSSGAALVSFNASAFQSFNKDQGANAPVGQYAATAYTTALNNLLSQKSRQRFQLGETAVVFWCDQKHQAESLFFDLFGEHPKEDMSKYSEAIKVLYSAPQTGVLPLEDDRSSFCVLGIGPNAARLSVRFWHKTNVASLTTSIKNYFHDLKICRPSWALERPTLMSLLLGTALLHQRKNIEPQLPSAILKAILADSPFPHSLLSSVIRRIRAERIITYERASLIKGYLNRLPSSSKGGNQDMTTDLDDTNTNVGYRLGRLFAVLEKVQMEALGDVNASIRDRYYAGASASPVTCFPILMRVKNHHLSKLTNKGRAVNLEKLIAQIIVPIKDFPPHLNLADQGRFAIGYYHQRQKFFLKAEGNTTDSVIEEESNDKQ